MRLSWKKSKKAVETMDKYNEDFCPLRCTIPRTWLPLLQQLAAEKNSSIAGLIVRLLDVGLDNPKLFDLDTAWPESEFVENQYAHVANAIYQFLLPWGPKGLTVDYLIFLRRQYGVKDRNTVLLGLRELYLAERIEVFTPKRGPNTKADVEPKEKFRVAGNWGMKLISEKGPL